MIFEKVVSDDKSADTVLRILKTIAKQIPSDLPEPERLTMFIHKANENERLKSYRVRISDQFEGGAARADESWITFPRDDSISATMNFIKHSIYHEFVHREQFKSVERDHPGSSAEMNKKWESAYGYDQDSENKDIVWRDYFNSPQEIMAYAKQDAMRIGRKPIIPSNLPILNWTVGIYLTPENRKRYLRYVAAYQAELFPPKPNNNFYM